MRMIQSDQLAQDQLVQEPGGLYETAGPCAGAPAASLRRLER
jgi:hypothetical protein